MLDLGTSFLASVARDPDALALVDGEVRFTYAQWLRKISSLVAAFDRMGLRPGDPLLTALQNNWQAATVHWACQLAGLIITPINWRVKADELDFCIENSGSRALVYQDISSGAVATSTRASGLILMRAGATSAGAGEVSLDALCDEDASAAIARRACRGAIVPSARLVSPMSRRTSIAAASGRLA
jgi:2-furoate---CoA ligase